MKNMDAKIESWGKKLLDLGKRNRLLNFKETKRSNINVLQPTMADVYRLIVGEERELAFSYPAPKVSNAEDTIVDMMVQEDAPEEIVYVKQGDFVTNQSILEQQKTLKSLRSKAKTAIEEQGVNVLYLAFGFLSWKENTTEDQVFRAPIILVPVTLTIQSLTAPYKLALHDDEIVVNPTLKYKLETQFNIILPEFDAEADGDVVGAYLDKVRELIQDYNWSVDEKVSLSLFSFLKINMYMDLHKHAHAVKSNFAVRALCGDTADVPDIPQALSEYDHDTQSHPIDVFQTVDADSSQQDAVLLSKQGVSFVLQGPPGTGKSQTITNIISEALADGKKVLFVSEKMAALEVVYKRLAKVGLSDFCLSLHNHKANKKEVLKALGDTLYLDRIKIKDAAIYKLTALDKDRALLKDYVRQLHEKQLPLDKTIYEVNGVLAKLQEAPNLLFDIENIAQTSADDLRTYAYSLQRLAATIGKLSEEYDVNVWNGCCVEQVTHALRQDIEIKANAIVCALDDFFGQEKGGAQTLDFEPTLCYDSLDEIQAMLQLCAAADKTPQQWLYHPDIAGVLKDVEQLAQRQADYHKAVDFMDAHYDAAIHTVNAQEISVSVNALFDALAEQLSAAYYPAKAEIYDARAEIKQICADGLAARATLEAEMRDTCTPLGMAPSQPLEDPQQWLAFLKQVNQIQGVTEHWFDPTIRSQGGQLLDALEKTQEELQDLRRQIGLVYEKEIFSVDYPNMLNRFKTEYTSAFKLFSANYKHDVMTLKGCRITPVKKISDAEILTLLNRVKAVKEREAFFEEQKRNAQAFFGAEYHGEHSNFAQLRANLDRFNRIQTYFKNQMPTLLKRLLLTGETLDQFTPEIVQLETILQTDAYLDAFGMLAKKQRTFAAQTELLHEISTNIQALEQAIAPFAQYATLDLTYEALQESIQSLCCIQSVPDELSEREEECKALFQFYFDGMSTDWQQIKAGLAWVATLMPYLQKYQPQEAFLAKVCSGQCKEPLGDYANEIGALKEAIRADFLWMNALYDTAYQMGSLPLANLKTKLNRCVMNLHGLEEWIDFKHARNQCAENGLSDAVECILAAKLQPQLVTDSFEKRFYKLWLDAILPQCPAVYHFRRKSQEDLIARFQELDVKQMKIAELRVKERLISNLPNLNNATSAVDEVGILKRELGKQRRIMPLRRLFAKIPTLLPVLKPCLMMSPLSVSLFLESELYQFDLVIFDEASQVCTENAIGAIMRAKQVIVAGDNKQLPPTNFFNATTSDSDYDAQTDDENDVDDFASILDELLTVFPERSLKWHYRSKNEQLITFSNVKIYGQSLITFPSVAESVADNGVEYVYVADGVYDRGGKKNNITEAKKVAELVFEHFEKGSGRSIGVIAFSEAQQQAIDHEITCLRIANPQWESFFREENDEAFFVKNLENVQGDERDTIIFSIGYAKDAKGVMHMNFGPLSKNGGYRRLNVAITRAKYNVKLVGSILPTDIRLESTNAQGVKMLRDYIEFAMYGQAALENELNERHPLDMDSPFEDAVYDFLVANGYTVSKQVGSSGYRIDMAVQHPTLAGRFVIAIECDGADYHASRTVRERDRLRQSVLEDMGWKFHRIWSTDWIKDPVTEGEILLNAVEDAIALYQDDVETAIVVYPGAQETKAEDYYETQEKSVSELEAAQFAFAPYVEVDVFAAREGDFSLVGLCSAMRRIIEAEYPIHYELLCRRVAPLYGNQKATVKIRKEVDCGLSRLGDAVVRIGDFFYPKEYEAVVPKAPAPGAAPRCILHISDDEIAVAMQMVVKDSYGIEKNNLFAILAKAFGFSRSGANITNAFERVFATLVANGTLYFVENKVSQGAE